MDFRPDSMSLHRYLTLLIIPRILSGILLLTAAAYGQVTGAISGTVEDPSGKAVDGATITVTSLETGTRRHTTTDVSGNYSVLALPLGPTEVKVEKAGFKPIDRTGIKLELDQNATVNFRLEVGEFVSQVNVSEQAPIVNTTTESVAALVGEKQIKDLPLNGRSFDNLITLNPGAIDYVLKSPGTSTSNGNTFAVNGRRPMDNIVLLNGIEYTGSSQLADTPGGASGELLGIDAVREFNILTDTYSAQYGKRDGAQVLVATQSGTNVIHGSLFEFIRNSDLDARNFFDQGFVPPFRRNQFGAALGGPVKKNRLFLFGNYEGFRQSLAESSVSEVPDQMARQGLLPNSSGVYTAVPKLNPAMLKYFALWPKANGPELFSNGLPSGTALAYYNPRQSIREDFGTARGDYALSDRDTLTASYTIDNGTNLSPGADPLFDSDLLLVSQVASLQETHVFSPYALNTARIGFSRAAYNFNAPQIASFPSSLDFVTGNGGPGGIVIGGGVTTTGVSAITSAGPNNAANVWNRRNLFTYQDDFQFTKGIHQFNLGVWFQPIQDNEDTASRQLGQASFSSLTTFLQGTLSSFQVVPNPTPLSWRSFFGAWYAEDVMKLRRNLTVRVGLRYEFTNGWNEAHDRAANYITNDQGVLETNPIVGHSVFTTNNATHLLGPRVGLAWDPFGDGKTAIRAGYGMYYSLIDDLSFLLNSLPPYNGTASFSGVSLPSILPIASGVQPAPSCGPGVPTPCTTYAPQGVQPDAKTPAVNEWNFTVERQLNNQTALSVAYVGSFGYHGLISVDPNSIPAQVCSNPAGCLAGGVGSVHSVVAQGASYIPVGTRPNQYLSGGFFWYTEGNTSYNALQTNITRRLSNNLEFRANYTWSKSLDLNSALTGAQSNNEAQMILNRNNLREDWGPSAFNAEHQASFSADYELPFGHGRLLGGWQLNGIATLLSGFPVTPQIGSSRSGDGDTRNPDRPSLNPAFNGPIVEGSPNQWFNPNAFILPAAGTYGNLGRGVLSGPGLVNLDLSLLKNIALTERINLQIRSEFFNTLNHANFGTPNAIVFSSGQISSTAGLITSTATTSRQIQFGMKLTF
ncbi:MAG TPA: carboxypeptidase-like regulatory domain-containing protein [Bryobacteraceae bacterium]|jgi:hypothetical protein|nr:carboxypeptidase-like regulatory domain-containing protein [Bryobacteraceae bacterium]